MNPEKLTHAQIGTPESFSDDPNLFERTVLYERLIEIAEKLNSKIHTADEAEKKKGFVRLELSTTDYEVVLECIDKLGDIGYFKTSGYEPEVPLSPRQNPEMTEEEHAIALQKYNSSYNIEENILDTFNDLFSDIKFMEHIPEGFFDSLYLSVSKHIQRHDSSAVSILSSMINSRIVPQSHEVVREVSRKILEAYDLDLYILFARVFLKQPGNTEVHLLSPEELGDIAMRLKRQGYIDEGEDIRKFAKHLRYGELGE